MDRRAWWATVHRGAKSRIRLSTMMMTVHYTDWFQMLDQSYIPEIYVLWSWYIILFICCWLWFIVFCWILVCSFPFFWYFFLVLVCVCMPSCFSHVWLFATPWTPLFIGFSRQEYWSGLPCLPPGNLPDPGIEPTSPALAHGFFTTEPPGKPHGIGIRM